MHGKKAKMDERSNKGKPEIEKPIKEEKKPRVKRVPKRETNWTRRGENSPARRDNQQPLWSQDEKGRGQSSNRG